MKKSEITNQELLQAINQNIDQKLSIQKDDILTAVNQNIDQKLSIQKDDILTAVNQNIDQKLSIQKDEILVAMDQKLEDQKNEILDVILKTAELDEQRFQKIENSLSNVEGDLKDIKVTINTRLVRKTDLDDKFAEFGVEHNYKHKRVDKLTNILHKKKILNVAETQIVLAN